MPWYRIVPKTGNRRYLELPAGAVDERDLQAVKALSCWSTQRKPKNKKELLQESCNPVIFIKKRGNYKIGTYITIRAIAEYLKVPAELFIRAVESPRGVYVCFYTNKITCGGLKNIMEIIFNKILHPNFPDCRFQASVPTKIFSQLKNTENCSAEYCFSPEKFSDDFPIAVQTLKDGINDARNKIPEKSIDLSVLVLKTMLEQLLEGIDRNDFFLFPRITYALNSCRYLKGIQDTSMNYVFNNQAIQNFLFSLGIIGKKYLVKTVFERKIKSTIDSAQEITPDHDPDEFQNLLSQLNEIINFSHHEKAKPMRCNKAYPHCGSWCGACSPIELIVVPENRQCSILSPSVLSQTSEKFVQQLSRDRVLFRRAEFHTKLPKSMRSVYDIEQALSHLIAINYIIPGKAVIKNFKPGKKSELFMINWPKILNNIQY